MSRAPYVGTYGGTQQTRPFGRVPGMTCRCGCERGHPCLEGNRLAAERSRAWDAHDMAAWEVVLEAQNRHLGLPPRLGLRPAPQPEGQRMPS